MAGSADHNLHSRVVAWLKVVLPLAALAILSTLFLVARTIDPSDAIPYAEVDVAERLREPRMTAPTYSGLTADGAAITLTATEARPDDAQTSGTAKLLTGRLATPDGATSEMAAATASLDQPGQTLSLGGGVRITNSIGWVITTDALTYALDQTDVQSAGPVRATGPLGIVDAGAMRLSQDRANQGAYLLVFTNRVKLIYQPKP